MHFFVFYSYVDVKKQGCLKPVTGEPYQHVQLRQNDGALFVGCRVFIDERLRVADYNCWPEAYYLARRVS
jgi:hypothetical protein